MSTDWEERLHTYNKPHCWQYDIRLNNLNEDLKQIQGVDYTTFGTPVEAAIAYDKAIIKIHGEFALTNFPKENYIKEGTEWSN